MIPSDQVRSGWTPNWSGRINIDGVGGQTGKYTLKINPFGFRGNSMRTAEKPNGTYRIFFMGGSFVEEMALPEEKTFPSLIQQKFEREFPNARVECVNAGISGFMSADLLAQFQHQILNYQPDLIVVTVPAINDLRYGTLPDYDAAHPLPAAPTQKSLGLWSKSRFLFVLYRFAGRYRQAHTPYKQSLEKYRDASKKSEVTSPSASKSDSVFNHELRLLIQLAKKKGVHVLLTSEPSVYQSPLPEEIKDMLWMGLMRPDLNLSPSFLESEMKRYNHLAQLISQDEAIPFVDLASLIPKDSTHFYDDVHLTPIGSLSATEAIYSKIKQFHFLLTQAP